MYANETRRNLPNRDPWGKHEIAGGCVENSKRKANKWKFQKEMFEDAHEGAHMKGMVY